MLSFFGGDEHINFCIEGEEHRIYKITHSDNFGCDVVFDPIDSELTGRNFIARGNDDPFFYFIGGNFSIKSVITRRASKES
ncbi:hypothetical protein BSZ32_13000 [Rubritalea profundi]|uniref:Uncharacterized protein n=1 Tax=Rubritalea profundi TaxID=1658618 RepID=A0A2S7U2V6_9BACT|nr:hypothetical protein BSZ32_13000 [Rubritalea profundi]